MMLRNQVYTNVMDSARPMEVVGCAAQLAGWALML